MIRSVFRYLINFLYLLISPGITHLIRDKWSFYFSKKFRNSNISPSEQKRQLKDACEWLQKSINPSAHGFRTYYYLNGWTSSYPETTGYIIPTLLRYAQYSGEDKWIQICKDAGNWLVDIQKESGGWQSGYVDEDKNEVVFNTGQVIRGLYALYKNTGEEKYIQSSIQACDWLCKTQDKKGFWKKNAFMQAERVYDSYVDHPLLVLHLETGIERYKHTAIRNLNWILTQQKENGWFANCDNTTKHNSRPILHTIAYTIDGLLQCGLILQEDSYILAAKKPADVLLSLFEKNGYLQGRYNENWQPEQFMICTGMAQIAIVWHQLWCYTGDEKYKIASIKMNHQLCYIARHTTNPSKPYHGALPGSFPLWGRYEPFGFPNWATKYFADSQLNELNAPPVFYQL